MNPAADNCGQTDGKVLDMKRWQSQWKPFKRQLPFHVFVWVGLFYLFVFHYIPMFGIVIAFKQYDITTGIPGMFQGRWMGLSHFRMFFADGRSFEIIGNTLIISLLKLVVMFPSAIAFAIAINELRGKLFKRFVQTVSYLPHFVSWIIIYGLLFTLLSVDDGLLNRLLASVGLIGAHIPFLSDAGYIWQVMVLSDAWKELGWNSIIFIAAIATINPSLYESAQIDGAGRWQKIRHITLPGIKGTASMLLILGLGNILGGGVSGSNFEQALLLGNDLNNSRAEILSTYVLKFGLGAYSGGGAMISYATAVGLVGSVISLLMIFGSNYAVKKSQGYGLF